MVGSWLGFINHWSGFVVRRNMGLRVVGRWGWRGSFVGGRGHRVVGRDWVGVIDWSRGRISRGVVGGGGVDSMNGVVRVVEADTNTGQVATMFDQRMVALVRLSCSNGKSQQQQTSSGSLQQQQQQCWEG